MHRQFVLVEVLDDAVDLVVDVLALVRATQFEADQF